MNNILKIATFNVVHCADLSNFFEKITPQGFNPQVKIQKYIDALNHLDADFIGLNEVYYTTNFDQSPDFGGQSNKLASGANYPFSIFARGFYFDDRNQDIGNAVLSRFPIISYKAISVPTPSASERRETETDWYEDRVIVVTDLDIKGTVVRFICTHFGLNGLEKERMVEKLISIIDETSYPLVLAGDFNSNPDDNVLQPIYDRLISVSEVAGIKDEKTFSTYNPYLTLDYIFVSKHFEVLSAKVEPLKLSDHFPLTATIKLK